MSAIPTSSAPAPAAPPAVTYVAPAPIRPSFSIDTKELMIRIVKYLIEGLAVGVSMWLVLRLKASWEEVLSVALVATATFSILDMFAPSISSAARQGTGFGLGMQMTNTPFPVAPATTRPTLFA